jgi:type I restriction enzyme R subunit
MTMDGTGETAIDQEKAVAAMLDKYEVCMGPFHGFNRSKWVSVYPEERLSVPPATREYICK